METAYRGVTPRQTIIGPPPEENLDRALVAGFMLEVILAEPGLPQDPQRRRRLVKTRLTDSLVLHLAGRITLDRFRTLVQTLNQWFPFYYPLMLTLARQSQERAAGPGPAARRPAGPTRTELLVRRNLLQKWLLEAGGDLLPRRPQRKIQPHLLEEFLVRTGGGWFRVKEFAQDFGIDRKTAWEYLQKLQGAGLLRHNRERSAAVCYCLVDRFLLVRLAALQRQVSQALPELRRLQAEQVTEWLAGTAGEAFWETQWLAPAGPVQREAIIAALIATTVLEVVYQSGGSRLLHLQGQWLQLENMEC